MKKGVNPEQIATVMILTTLYQTSIIKTYRKSTKIIVTVVEHCLNPEMAAKLLIFTA